MLKGYKKYAPEELKKLQSDMLVVLRKFDALCEKHSINYFAVGGTLLGAVRHTGYIPWDDDIDIGMLKEDYDKFLKIPSEEFEGFGLYAPEINAGDYYSFVTKFYYKNSRFISSFAELSGVDYMGIFIELFPFYNIPKDEKIINDTEKKIERIKALYSVISCKKIAVIETGISGKIKFLLKAVIRMFLKLFRVTPKKLAKKYDTILNRYQNSDTDSLIACSDIFKVFPKNWFASLKRVPFEDTTIPIPEKFKDFLISLYGDNYMSLPDETKRWNQAAKYLRFIDGTEIREEK